MDGTGEYHVKWKKVRKGLHLSVTYKQEKIKWWQALGLALELRSPKDTGSCTPIYIAVHNA